MKKDCRRQDRSVGCWALHHRKVMAKTRTREAFVEVRAVGSHSGSKLYTVVKPLRMSAADVPTVHGISYEKLAQGPPFSEAFKRPEQFLNFAIVRMPESDSDSDTSPTPARFFKHGYGKQCVDKLGHSINYTF